MNTDFINLTTANLAEKSWLSDQSFAKKFGFEVVDTTDNSYELLALSFDGTTPKFAERAKCLKIESQELTIYYDMQCPYIHQNIGMIKEYCQTNSVPVNIIQVDTLQKAKELPCVFKNWGVFYKGELRNGKFTGCELLEKDIEEINIIQ